MVAFSLPEDLHARVAVLEAGGRTLWSRDYLPAAPGEQSMRVEGGAPLAPGTYRVVVEQGPRMAMARVALAP